MTGSIMSDTGVHSIEVSLVYATPEKQWLYESRVSRGTSATDLIEQSCFLRDIEALRGQAIDDLKLGIYAQRINPDALLEEGDRVEIYRELTADPKEVRRQLALLGKAIGSK